MSDMGIMILLFVGVMGLVGLIRFLAWLTDLKEEHGSVGKAGLSAVQKYVSVKHSPPPTPSVMSRSSVPTPSSPPSSLRQTEHQTDRQEETQRIRAEELLTLCKLMRAAGINREDAQSAFKASGLPFNNNVWRDAAPPEPPHVTPIAGRPTSAQFQEDADLAYEPLS